MVNYFWFVTHIVASCLLFVDSTQQHNPHAPSQPPVLSHLRLPHSPLQLPVSKRNNCHAPLQAPVPLHQRHSPSQAPVSVVLGPTQSHPPVTAPTGDCTSVIFEMVDCMTFLSNGVDETKPERSCCLGLKTVLKADANCLCVALKSSVSLGLDINMTRAMILPSACGVPAPVLSQCDVSAAPVAPPPNQGHAPVPPHRRHAPSQAPESVVLGPTPSHPPVSLVSVPTVDCTSLIFEMVDCMAFLSNGFNETKPERSCCLGLKTVLKVDVGCLCVALETSSSLGIDINVTQAMTLPSACGVSAPLLSHCDVSTPPAAPPANQTPAPQPVKAPSPKSSNPPKSPAPVAPLVINPPKSSSLPAPVPPPTTNPAKSENPPAPVMPPANNPPKCKTPPAPVLPPATNQPKSETPTTNPPKSKIPPAALVSPPTIDSPVVAPSVPKGGSATKTQAPSPTSSGVHTVPTYFTILFSLTVASFLCILA